MKRVLCLLLLFMLILPAQAQTVQDEALAFIQEAGIGADSVMRVGDEIIVTLPGGGTAKKYSPGDFDEFDLNWQFSGATDEELALYLDHALSLLFALEARIPADMSDLSLQETIRVRSYAAVIEKALLSLENVGQQGLAVLQGRMAAQPDSALNDLRARLAAGISNALAEEAPSVIR